MMEATDSYPGEKKACILWSSVARNNVVLAEASLPDMPWQDKVKETAHLLRQKKETPGWEFVTSQRRLLFQGGQHSRQPQERTPILKGMKFHIFEHLGDDHDNYHNIQNERTTTALTVWSVSAIYNPSTVDSTQVQSFIEKIVTISEMFRETNPNWKYGPTYAAQQSFAPILLQRMEEVSYLGKMAMIQDNVDHLKQVMSRNIEMILEREEKLQALQQDATQLEQMASVFQKKSKNVRRAMLWKNAKHGLILGTAITAGVAVVVVPPLIAIL